MKGFSMLLLFLLALVASGKEVNLNTAMGVIGDRTLPILVSCVDGSLMAVDPSDGTTMWSFHSGAPLVSSFSKSPQEERIFPGIDGSLMFKMGKEPLQTLDINVQKLVGASPFVSESNKLITGQKQSKMYAINVDTGLVVSVFGGGGVGRSDGTANDPSLPNDDANLLHIGRSDHVVNAADISTGAQLWNSTFGVFLPDSVISERDSGLDVRLDVLLSGMLVATDRNTGSKAWQRMFSSHPVTVFEVADSLDGTLMVLELRKSPVLVDESGQSGKSVVFVGQHDQQLFVVPESSSMPVKIGTAAIVHGVDDSNALSVYSDNRDDFVGFHTLKSVAPLFDVPLIDSPPPVYIEVTTRLVWPVLLAAVGGLVLGGIGVAYVFKRRRPKPSTRKKKSKQPQQPVKKKKKPGKVGRLQLCLDRILGYGSGGTIVYEGKLDGRRVAVKRMLRDFFDLAEKETNVLLQADEHPNVVSYYTMEEDTDFVYLALSFCEYTLVDVVSRRLSSDQARSILRGLCQGLAHLHQLDVVHRDLKPQNVLLDASYHVFISDMGLAKRVEVDQHSFSSQAYPGSVGWQAPELLKTNSGRQSRAQDIFSLGCLVYYVLTGGNHPFGDRMEREINILNNNVDISQLHADPVASHLVFSCLQANPANRLTTEQVLVHPFWWSAADRLYFLNTVSDMLEVKSNAKLEKRKQIIIGDEPWAKQLSPMLIAELGKFRKYEDSVKDLLRVIRNKSNHYRDLSPQLKRLLGGSYPDGYLGYFERLFPHLFIQVYSCFRKQGCFKNFYRNKSKHHLT